MAVLGVGAGAQVTSQMDADFYAGILGDKKMVLPVGKQMEAELIDNNTVRIHDGVAIIQGRYVYVEANTYDEFKIENGTQGVNRYDIIGYRLYREDGKEFCENVVTKDVGASGTVETEVFRDGGQEVFIPMYRVQLDELSIVALEPLFETLYTADRVKTLLTGLTNRTVEMMEHIISVANDQMREYPGHLELASSEYMQIDSQKTLVNIRTGEVYIRATGTMLQTADAGKNFIVARLRDVELIPEDNKVIPITVVSNLNNIGNMKAALYPAGHSNYKSQIRGTVINQITKGSLVYIQAQYFVDPEKVRNALGIQEPALKPLDTILKPLV